VAACWDASSAGEGPRAAGAATGEGPWAAAVVESFQLLSASVV
jgi:hypothetical protein